MPTKTVEQLGELIQVLKTKVKELGDDADPTQRRLLRRKLRRAQRRRRRMVTAKGKAGEAAKTS